MAQLKAGSRWQSAVCSTEVMVVLAPDGEAELTCGGAPVIEMGADKPGGSPADGADGGTQIGKRYVDEAASLEVLCTKPGDGALGLGGELLKVKGAKPLPSSD
jgi:hypothetical protein